MFVFNWTLLTKLLLVFAFVGVLSMSTPSDCVAQIDDGGDGDGDGGGDGDPLVGGVLISADGLLSRRAVPNLSLIHI